MRSCTEVFHFLVSVGLLVINKKICACAGTGKSPNSALQSLFFFFKEIMIVTYLPHSIKVLCEKVLRVSTYAALIKSTRK